MKKIILFWIFFVCLYSPVEATGQMGELIIVGKDTLELLGCPLEVDSVWRSQMQGVVFSENFSTANYRGYIGVWRLDKDTLFLEGIRDIDGNDVNTPRLENFFNYYKRGGRVAAVWYSGMLRVGAGKNILYGYGGFERDREQEWIYTVEKGRVVSHVFYQNVLKKADFPMKKVGSLIQTLYDRSRFPELRNKKLVFGVKVWPKPDGTIDSLEIWHRIIEKKDPMSDKISEEEGKDDFSNPYVQELLSCLKCVPAWDYLLIRGEIQPIGQRIVVEEEK